MVRELAGLKARLFWNGLRSDRQRQIGLPLIFVLIGWVTWQMAGAHLDIARALDGQALVEYLAWTAIVVFVAWVALPVVIFPLDESLDPEQLAALPIPRSSLAAGLVSAGLISPPVLAAVALIATTIVIEPLALVVTLPAGAVFLVMLVVGSQAFTTVISAILHSRRGRDLAVFLIMGIGLGSFAAYQTIRTAVADMGMEAAVMSAPIDGWWWLIPPAAPAHAISHAWSGDWAEAFVALGTAVVWTGLLAIAWDRVLWWILTTPAQSGGESSLRRGHGLSRGWWSIPMVVARKELRFYVRDPRQRLVWTGTVIFVGLAVAAIVVGSEGFAQFRSKEWLPLVAPVLVLMVGLPVALNQFGWERNAASYLFALPGSPRSIIFGKNLAATAGLAAETVFLAVLFAWFSSSWRWTPLIVPLAASAICCLLAVGNVVSILTPLRLPREGTDVFAQATEQGLLALASQVVSFFVIGLLLVLPASSAVLTVSFGGPVPAWFTAVFALAWGAVWYGISILLSGWLLRRRIPEVVGWVQVS